MHFFLLPCEKIEYNTVSALETFSTVRVGDISSLSVVSQHCGGFEVRQLKLTLVIPN